MKPFTLLAIAVLAFISLAHLLRLLFGWEIIINGTSVPVWISIIPTVVFAVLAYMLWRESKSAK